MTSVAAMEAPRLDSLARPDALISNVDHILAPGGRVTGPLAQKVIEISGRAVWYAGHEVTVLPGAVDPDFLEYVSSFGTPAPEVIVPSSLDPTNFSMQESMKDPEVVRAMRGHWAESYIGNRALLIPVALAGGRYWNGDPGQSVEKVNDKELYAEYARGIIAVPPGEPRHGLDDIANGVFERLLNEGAAFVRHTDSGGGFGNRRFDVSEIDPNDRDESLRRIKEKLCGSRPDLWENGTALVEQHLDLISTPSVNFDTESGVVIDGDQITKGSDYWGAWTPAPPWRYDHGYLNGVGQGLRERVRETGFWGRAGSDLGRVAAGSVPGAEGDNVGFEINGRSTALRHVQAIGERLWGPWETWRKKGFTAKAIDHFLLKRSDLSFRDLHRTLAENNMLASPSNPFGVVISIPPAGEVAGLVILGRGYEATERLYRRVQALVGHPTANTEDYPIFDQKMREQ